MRGRVNTRPNRGLATDYDKTEIPSMRGRVNTRPNFGLARELGMTVGPSMRGRVNTRPNVVCTPVPVVGLGAFNEGPS